MTILGRVLVRSEATDFGRPRRGASPEDTAPVDSQLHAVDMARTATVGMRTRKMRTALSTLGIMIGIAAMVGVLGISQSSKSELLAELDALGTNLPTVQASGGIGLGTGELPDTAAEMVARIGPVEITFVISTVEGANVYRTDYVPVGETNGITVEAVDLNLLDTLAGSVADGAWLDEVTAPDPTTVLARSQPNDSE